MTDYGLAISVVQGVLERSLAPVSRRARRLRGGAAQGAEGVRVSVSLLDARVVERRRPLRADRPAARAPLAAAPLAAAARFPTSSPRRPGAPPRAAAAPGDVFRRRHRQLLGLADPADCEALRRAAFDLTSRVIGDAVHYRGLIEFSNVCRLNCRYCGIRKGNRTLPRYMLSKARIVESALWAAANGYGSVCLQSGERRDERFVRFVEAAFARSGRNRRRRRCRTASASRCRSASRSSQPTIAGAKPRANTAACAI